MGKIPLTEPLSATISDADTVLLGCPVDADEPAFAVRSCNRPHFSFEPPRSQPFPTKKLSGHGTRRTLPGRAADEVQVGWLDLRFDCTHGNNLRLLGRRE
jgi:hypothetical protein